MARLFACSVCGKVHDKSYICSAKRKARQDINKGRIDTGVYRANKWRTIRGQVLEDCNHICLYTFYKERKIVEAKDVHHIIELLDDETLAFEEDNLIALSKEKHKLIHELYKNDKKTIQNELREMKSRWKNNDRELGYAP